MKLTSILSSFALYSIVLGAGHHKRHGHVRHDKGWESNVRPGSNNVDDSLNTPWPPWQENGAGIRTSAYYVNWAIYGRQYFPYQLQTENMTHLHYAFANLDNVTGEVYLTDLYADVQVKFAGDDTNATGNNLYGNLHQLYLLKKQNRNLKTMLSIGGYTYSPNFAPGLDTDTKRQLFVDSSVKLLEDLGMDGIDIDWEYPASGTEASNFVDLLRKLRTALDIAEQKRSNTTHFYISAAVSAGPANYQSLDVRNMAQVLDFWNLMAYDYAGSFSNLTGFQSNVFPSQSNPAATPFNTADAVQYYLTNGVSPAQLLLGMPAYGRAFTNTKGPGQPYQGVGNGSWEDGVWDYKVLPLPGCVEGYDSKTISSYCYNNGTQTFITYDTPTSVKDKAQWAQSLGLGGGMWWETSGDKPVGQGNLIEAFVQNSGGTGNLRKEQNCLEYPESQYDNIRS